MARSFTGIAGDNLQSASVIATGQPLWQSAWIKPNGFLTNGVFVFTTGTSGSNSSSLSTGYDSSNSGKASGRTVGSGGSTVQALTSTTVTDAVWSNLLGNNVSNTSRVVWLNGAGKGTGASNQGVGTLNLTRISGNSLATSGTYYKGLVAHLAGGTGTLTDQEAAFIGAGGHPRAIKSCTYYCRLNQNASPETADLGSISLTVNGATFSNADMPVVASHFISSAIADQTWTQNSAITAVTYTFEDVTSAFTVSLYKVGASGGTTTATAAGTTTRIVPLTSATGFVANDYLTVGAGAKTRILSVSGLNALVAADQTFSINDTVTRFPVSSQAITGITVANTQTTGTPTGTQATTADYFYRAINNTTAALVADSNLFSITINAAAGGGTPGFSSGPTLNSANTDGYTFGGTPNQTATCYLVALIKGSAAPTGAQVKSGSPTGFVSRFTAAVTNATPFTISATALTNPLYDLHLALDNANGTGAVQSFTNRQKLPAAGRQYTTLGALSGTTPLSVVSPALAVGDVLDCVTTTSPGAYSLTASSAGDFQVNAGGDQSRQFIAFNVYDVSAGAMYYTSDSNVVLNDQPPVVGGPKTYTLAKAATIDLTPIVDVPITDPESDTLTLTENSALLAGLNLSINGSMHIVGTLPNASSSTVISLRATDNYGAFTDFNITLAVGQVTLPDLVNLLEPAAAGVLAGLSLVEQIVIQPSPLVAGTVLDQFPAALTVVNVGSTVLLTVAAGSGDILPSNFLDDVTLVNPATAVFYRGRAYNALTGAMYVALWPANNSIYYVAGIAHRFDGAMLIAPGGAITNRLGGLGMTFRGEVVAVIATADVVQNGLPLKSDGTLCMTDIS